MLQYQLILLAFKSSKPSLQISILRKELLDECGCESECSECRMAAIEAAKLQDMNRDTSGTMRRERALTSTHASLAVEIGARSLQPAPPPSQYGVAVDLIEDLPFLQRCVAEREQKTSKSEFFDNNNDVINGITSLQLN